MSFKVAYYSFEGGMSPPFNYVVKLQICFIEGDAVHRIICSLGVCIF